MSDSCPTVKVKADNDQGFVVINESDFDENVHTKLSPKAEAKADAEVAASAYDGMNKQDLIEAAVARGVEIQPSSTKADIIAALSAEPAKG